METQTQPEQNLSKKERRQLRRKQKRQEAEQVKKVSGRKNMFIWAAIIAIVSASGFGMWTYLFSGDEGVEFDVTNVCVNHIAAGMHIHPDLRIVINGESREIPANIGISAGCMRPLHTHDNTGRLHVEFSRQRNFTLEEFFKVWDKPFRATQILDYITDDMHTLSVTVNGAPNNEFENFVFKDRDQVEIRYGQISE